MRIVLVVGALMLALAAPAYADVFGVDEDDNYFGGSDTIAGLGYTMSAVDLSGITNGTTLNSFSSTAGTINLSASVSKREVGAGGSSGWGTWSGGRAPDVLYSQSGLTVTLTLPGGITAFDLYIEPESFASDAFEITASVGGVDVVQDVNGNAGAKYFGFYATGGSTIGSITISAAEGSNGFAFGEMRLSTSTGVNPVPEPASLALLGLGLAGAGAARRRRRRLAG